MPTTEEQLDDLRQQLEQLRLTTRKNVPAIPLPKFKGRDDTRPFATFLDEFNAVALAMDWNDTVKCQMLPAALESEANAIYHTLTNTTRNDWKQLLTELGQRLASSSDNNYHRQQLQSRTQKDGESISEYGRAIRFLVRRSFPDSDGISAVVQEKFEVDYFLGGLKPNVKEQLMRRNRPDSLETAIIKAQKEETLQRDIRRDYETRSLAINAICLAEKQRELQEQVDEIKRSVAQPRNEVAFVQEERSRYDQYDEHRWNVDREPNWTHGWDNSYQPRRNDRPYRRWDSRSPARDDTRPRFLSPPPVFHNRPRDQHRGRSQSPPPWDNRRNYGRPGSYDRRDRSPVHSTYHPHRHHNDDPIRPRYHVNAVRHLQFPCLLIALLALAQTTMAFTTTYQHERHNSSITTRFTEHHWQLVHATALYTPTPSTQDEIRVSTLALSTNMTIMRNGLWINTFVVDYDAPFTPNETPMSMTQRKILDEHNLTQAGDDLDTTLVLDEHDATQVLDEHDSTQVLDEHDSTQVLDEPDSTQVRGSLEELEPVSEHVKPSKNR